MTPGIRDVSSLQSCGILKSVSAIQLYSPPTASISHRSRSRRPSHTDAGCCLPLNRSLNSEGIPGSVSEEVIGIVRRPSEGSFSRNGKDLSESIACPRPATPLANLLQQLGRGPLAVPPWHESSAANMGEVLKPAVVTSPPAIASGTAELVDGKDRPDEVPRVPPTPSTAMSTSDIPAIPALLFSSESDVDVESSDSATPGFCRCSAFILASAHDDGDFRSGLVDASTPMTPPQTPTTPAASDCDDLATWRKPATPEPANSPPTARACTPLSRQVCLRAATAKAPQPAAPWQLQPGEPQPLCTIPRGGAARRTTRLRIQRKLSRQRRAVRASGVSEAGLEALPRGEDGGSTDSCTGDADHGGNGLQDEHKIEDSTRARCPEAIWLTPDEVPVLLSL